MISYVLLAGAATSVAAGIYTLATKRLPPIFPDEHGNRGAPDIAPDAVPRWGIGFVLFGVLLALVSFGAATLTHQ
jgi:Na+/proline symporter